MIRTVTLLCSLLLFVSCEDTNVLLMTGAAVDAVNAVTLSDADVRKLALRAAYEADSKHQVAPAGNPYDTRLQRLLVKHSARDSKTFNFKVYLTREVNAFAMADGSIRVFSGLMDRMSDEELLFVIGHEMGHVVKDHSRKKVVLAYTTSAVKKGLAAQNNEVGQIAGSMIGAFAEQLTHAQFSQHEERQADNYGAAFLRTEGHDTAAAVSALEKLAELARQHTFLSSHPDPETRAKRIAQGKWEEDSGKDSALDRVLDYAKRIAIILLQLVRSLVNWLLAML
ncbi:MAG: M48 family metallopeptidase [Desulforhopalus sp.]|nr:M48 family metallopeptidase [Desulforhopalus sp.]